MGDAGESIRFVLTGLTDDFRASVESWCTKEHRGKIEGIRGKGKHIVLEVGRKHAAAIGRALKAGGPKGTYEIVCPPLKAGDLAEIVGGCAFAKENERRSHIPARLAGVAAFPSEVC
ncbi:MAG: hypothetical protein JXR94_13110 [Candidatus Hydrogenedentes bacterium]|nr:hypothetical protein [Candidatus Hydrogenedentota bacterium]